MFHFEPGADRWKLGFKETVVASFKFLHKYGFDCVRAEPTFVRYETKSGSSGKQFFVNIYHGRGSYELGVEIGPCDSEKNTITLLEIVKSSGAEKAEGFGEHVTFQVSSRKGVQEFVPKLASLVKKYAVPFLQGDAEIYKLVLEERRLASARHRKEMELSVMREKAENSWHSKDYAQVVNLYEPFQEDLSQSEGMRLEYAKKQVIVRPVEGLGER